MPTVAQRYVQQRGAARGPAHAGGTERSAPVVLMVSGGADSTALLVMACTSSLDIADGRGCAPIARERLHVLHVNHHLRGEASDGDEAFVRALCERFGVPLCVEHASFSELGGQNLEAAAREVRYAAARRLVRELSSAAGTPRSAARILTAHTASDRAETFFMNAIKGSGPAGLSSIPRRRNVIVRPLIDYTHEQLVRYLEVRGQEWREDESNQDTSYLRNFIRHRIVPLASECNAQLERAVCSSCDILGDEDAFMSQLAATALRACTVRRQDGLVVLDGRKLAAAEIAIARRMVRRAVDMLDDDARLEMRHVETVLALVGAGAGSATLPNGIDARLEFGALTLRTRAAREELVAGWLELDESFAVANGCVLEARLQLVPAGDDPVALAREVSAASTVLEAGGTSANGAAADARPRIVLVDAESLGYAERDLEALCAPERRGGNGAVPVSHRPRLWVDAPSPGDVMCPLGMSGRSKKLSDVLGTAKIPVADRPLVPVLRTAPSGAIVWAAGVRVDERFKCTPRTRYALRLEMRRVIA